MSALQIMELQDRLRTKQAKRKTPLKKKVKEDNFVTYDNGVVYNTKTGLEWYPGPDEDINWYGAKEWVESLSVDGGGWRMPTKEELRTLYKNGIKTHNMIPPLKTTGWFVWSGETENPSLAGYFNFGYGTQYWIDRNHFVNSRVFAVRTRSG